MVQKEAKKLTTPRSGGPLAFTLGCLPLILVGLIVQLVTESQATVALQVLMLVGWLLTGAIAAIGFFLLSRPSSKTSGSPFVGELVFALIGITTALTVSITMLSNQLTMGEAAIVASSETRLGIWSLGVLLGLGALTLPTSIWFLILMWLPGICIWLIGAIVNDPNEQQLGMRGLEILIALGPTIVISAVRMRNSSIRQQREMLERQVKAFGGELDRARQIHDSMFPEPIEGDIRLEYTYDPLLGIGGDFLHIHQHKNTGRVTLTILDVSGHGLAAALTVNRLFGELERICAEHPDEITPTLLMSGLNRYVHLVMAKHSLYATAACVQMDPSTSNLHWVVSGHPPPTPENAKRQGRGSRLHKRHPWRT